MLQTVPSQNRWLQVLFIAVRNGMSTKITAPTSLYTPCIPDPRKTIAVNCLHKQPDAGTIKDYGAIASIPLGTDHQDWLPLDTAEINNTNKDIGVNGIRFSGKRRNRSIHRLKIQTDSAIERCFPKVLALMRSPSSCG